MAKVKYSAPGRNAQTRAKPESNLTREESIKHMVALGFDDVAIWGALGGQYPSIIRDDAERRRKAGKSIPFDPKLFKAIGEQLRSVKGLEIKEQQLLDGMIAPASASVESVDDTEFCNRRRWMCGWPALDYIFGETKYVHTEDAPNSKYRKDPFEYWDGAAGKTVKTTIKVWIKGDYQKGDPICYDEKGKLLLPRLPDGSLVGEDVRKLQKIEKGLPIGYFGFIGGQAGVGKSRAMIELTKAINSVGRLVHYYNGEADRSDFRSWCGANINPILFRVFHTGKASASGEAALVPLSVIENCAKREKPSCIIIDSFQLVAECAKGYAGQRRALARLMALKASDEAARPTIIIISQLNKKQELAGHKFLEHMVDFSIKVFRRQAHKNQFFMDSMKMRGAECPRGQLFKHTDDGVICLNTEYQSKEMDLVQRASLPPAVVAGVQNPPIAPNNPPTPAAPAGGTASADAEPVGDPNAGDTVSGPQPDIIDGDAGSLA